MDDKEGPLSISSVERWDVHPGDVLLVKVPADKVTRAEMERAGQWLNRFFEPLGACVVVVDDDLSFSVLRPESLDGEDEVPDLRRL